jgi:hypothetical protein
MMEQLPKPPIPTGVDLHDFSFTPIFRVQLFRSTFHAQAGDAEWRAGVTLWLKSWDQIPAGSLPDSDVELCRLAELGRDQRTWKKVKGMALHGWYICNDGRLYHEVVAQGVMAAHLRRKAASDKGKVGASKRWSLIEGGKGHSTGNGATNAPAIAQAMPGDSNLTLDIRDSNPLPPFEKGVTRHRRSPERTERDKALEIWNQLTQSGGTKPARDSRLQSAIDAIGGWPRIQQRSDRDEAYIRSEFCQAYQARAEGGA